MKKDISHTIVLIFAITIVFYISKKTKISPIYIIYLLQLPFVVIYLLSNMYRYSIPKDVKLLFYLGLYIVLLVMFVHTDSIFSGEFINLFISIYAYIFIRVTKNNVKEEKLKKIIKAMVTISVIILCMDSIYRILNPDYFADTEYLKINWFYYYKINSIMFADSNTTASISIILYFFILQLDELEFSLGKLYLVNIKRIILLILLFSFSRAAYIALIIGIVYFKVKYLYFEKYKKIKIFIKIIIPIICIALVFIILILFKNDLSFMSRKYIIEKIIEVFKNLSIKEKLFGIGFQNWFTILGIYTHNLFFSYFVFTGIVGIVIFVSYLLYVLKKIDIVIFPFILVSLSFFTYLGTPFLFIPIALTLNLYENKYRRKI